MKSYTDAEVFMLIYHHWFYIETRVYKLQQTIIQLWLVKHDVKFLKHSISKWSNVRKYIKPSKIIPVPLVISALGYANNLATLAAMNGWQWSYMDAIDCSLAMRLAVPIIQYITGFCTEDVLMWHRQRVGSSVSIYKTYDRVSLIHWPLSNEAVVLNV